MKNQYEFLTVGQRFTDGSEMPEDTQNPSTPTNVGSDFITTQRARINWTASTDNDRIARYNLKLTGAGETVSATTMAVSHTFENLKSNTTYTVEVIAEDRSGNVSDAATYTFTTLEESESTLSAWDPATVYLGGERVTYEGLIYEARHWTQNDIPSESGPYGPWRLVTK